MWHSMTNKKTVGSVRPTAVASKQKGRERSVHPRPRTTPLESYQAPGAPREGELPKTPARSRMTVANILSLMRLTSL